MKHILSTRDFDRRFIDKMIEQTDLIANNDGRVAKIANYGGFILASLFYEPSTRTRLSFESAAIKMGGNVISVEDAMKSSSATKGESIYDTVRIVGSYADLIVLRSPVVGIADEVAEFSSVPIINAGDGIRNHPTQALTDIYTLNKELGGIDGKHILVWGDMEYARTIHSIMSLLDHFETAKITTLDISQGEPSDDILSEVDAVYMTRPQTERNMKREGEFFTFTKAMLSHLKKDAIIMHPLPRTQELPDEILNDPRAVIFRQAKYGLYMRMALIREILSE